MADPEWLTNARAGRPFRMVDMEFISMFAIAREKVAAYPAAMRAGFEPMRAALVDLLGSVGEGVIIIPPLMVDVGINIELGAGTIINGNATLLDSYPIRIGRDVMVGPNCALYPVGHPLKAEDRFIRDTAGNRVGSWSTGAPIVIEDEAWIGGNVIVLPGVTIGARSMIGAGSVVTKSVPPDVFAAGNPCRVIRLL